ncbi:MAG: hypothetical protein HY548_09565 [Elusimicrobia bacterium]|nr:hypothetical protein [Elusimicrobiota bacterium]
MRRSSCFLVPFLFLSLNAFALDVPPAAYAQAQGNQGLEEMFFTDLVTETGKQGGFGFQLESLKLEPYVHGYTAAWYRTNDLNRRKMSNTFSLQYFNVLVGLHVDEKLTAEIMMEYEHAGDEISIRYGFLDYNIDDYLTLRAGKFLVPMGKFNEYYYPEYINKLNDRPIVLWHVVPSVWSEVGAQLRGKVSSGDGRRGINYAVYTVNGLQQAAGEGGDIRSLRENHRDYGNDDKAYGGRIGFLPLSGLEVGGSYYAGEYTATGRNLSILDADVEYALDKLVLRGEYVWARQGITNKFLKKNGFYAETAYRVNRRVETALRFDQANLDGVKGYGGVANKETVQRSTLGVTYFPMPRTVPRFSYKVNYSAIHNDGAGNKGNELVLQTAIGF